MEILSSAEDIESKREAVQAYKDTFVTSQTVDVFAQSDPYVSNEAYNGYNKAWDASLGFRDLVDEQAESGKFDRAKLSEEDNRAVRVARDFREIARRDLRTSDIDLSLPPSS